MKTRRRWPATITRISRTDLLNALTTAAETEGKTADELIAEAARLYLEHKGLDDLVSRGRSYAQRTGRKPSDAVAAVREIRRGR